MTHELVWGMPVIGYLFLAGLGAGALTVSASIFLRSGGGGFGSGHFAVARYGAFLAPIPAILGCLLLVFELGSFEAGHWFRWLNLYTVINLSPMSIGTWLLTAFIGVSLAYAYTFWPQDAAPGDRLDKLRKTLAWICVPLGISVAVYTGVLLGAMPGRPFWNSPILAMLFLLSSLSTGIAAIMLTQAVLNRKSTGTETGDEQHHRREFDSDTKTTSYLLSATDTILIGFELLAIFLFLMFAHLTVGDVKHAVSIILFGDKSMEMFGANLALVFWFWVVLVGLLVPALVELFYVTPRLLYQRRVEVPWAVELAVPIAILIGGLMLRYVIVVAGQVTSPVGI
ncbi:MAG TPA: hypothetical protein ENG78_05250 [Acidiferrobacteraceae bacterium]|nr:hypothetical protein [Acidiferrobacteraceae bacterium]HEX20208.1 hypothetical protein [Acidiferrobacteraceae bacterium]